MKSESARARLPHGVRVFERGWLSSNNVLVVGRSSAALVDSGYATHSRQTLDLVGAALAGRLLTDLVATHLHSDHCGGHAVLQAAYPHVRTSIPPGQADAVRRWDPIALTYAPTGQTCPRFEFSSLLIPGTEVALGDLGWQIHAAPGHDPHSVVLFEPTSRTLLSADALWENGFGVVFPELEGDRAFGDVGATLDLIDSLRPLTVVPGHGSVFSDVDGALARARSRLAAYQADPVRHAAHAAKVLLKFKLLELQRLPYAAFLDWAQGTAYFSLVQRRWFPRAELREWISALLSELVRAGAAGLEGADVHNL
jgi:glyoxylase-like metal-dependent hydrolase (beta-lactamase superfamily II)